MDKNAIKKYAVWARRELISRVSGRAAWYGITEDSCVDADADNIDGRVLSAIEKEQRAAFISKVQHEGYEQAIEEVAYTWFNRFCALRYMEVNGYLPSHIRVFTDDANEFKPQILDEAIHMEMEGLDTEKVLIYKDANDMEGLYRYLLITQCNALSSILPGMFQKIEDYTELLLPENLLREGSVIERMITDIPKEDWTDQVQIIGWLYQYYNAEKKDEVFAALKKNVKITKENIPAATQLFTPDWVVRYMVENSLGRLWIEGHPNDNLKSSWKYFLDEPEQEPKVEKQLNAINKEYSTLKPQDIKCIDPCCGSGHILVYMFDVLMQIYKSCGCTASESVCSIVNNNLFGLDIDERAAQLTYFAIMIKARSYDNRFFSRGIQPHVYAIQESNSLSENWLTIHKQMQPLFDIMRDAKDYGSIIEAPDLDYGALRDTAQKWIREINQVNIELDKLQRQLPELLSMITVAETLSKKYDVTVTNPPYMSSSGMSPKLSKYVKKNFPDSKSDLFSVFIERCRRMSRKNRFQTLITQPSFLSLSSFEKLRTKIFNTCTIISLLDMGRGIFGIDFGSTSFVIKTVSIPSYKGIYFNLKKRVFQYIAPDDISTLFLAAKKNPQLKYDFDSYNTNNGIKLNEKEKNAQQICYLAQQEYFAKIPGSPIAYWASNAIYKAFENKKLGEIGTSSKGIITGDNNRFLRLWQEISWTNFNKNAKSVYDVLQSTAKWYPCRKGGPARKWFGNNEYVINWLGNGYEVLQCAKKEGRNCQDYSDKFKFAPSICWTSISSGKPTFRFGRCDLSESAGMSYFSFEGGKELYLILGFLNSKVADTFLSILSPTINYTAGAINGLPFKCNNKDKQEKIYNTVLKCILLSKSDWDSFETSWDFQRHPLVCQGPSIISIYSTWNSTCNSRFEQLKLNEEELNQIFIDIYELQDELTPEVEDAEVTVRKADLQRDIRSLISYAVGCMFGRYSLDVDGLAYAGGEWDISKYETYQPDYDGILPICDDEYFTDDIVGRFVDFIRTVYGSDTLEENLQFIADALGGKGSSREVIRKYFLNDFFADHCKIYQKRPIYWLFDSGKKNGFKCLIYLHRYRPDTIARIRTDYVHEQQARYRTAIADLENRIETASTSDRIKLNKELKKVQEQADELHDYEEKIHHLADQYIDIDLDDGVKVNYAKFQDVLAKIK